MDRFGGIPVEEEQTDKFGGVAIAELSESPVEVPPEDIVREQKRRSLAQEMEQARIERQQGEAVQALADLGQRAAYTAASVGALADPLGLIRGQMEAQGTPAPPRVPPILKREDISTIGEVGADVVRGLGGERLGLLSPLPPKAEAIRAGTVDAAAGLLTGLSSPEMMGQLGAAKVMPREIGRLFQAQMIAGLPAATEELVNAEDLRGATTGALNVAGAMALPGAIERGLAPRYVPVPDIPGRALPVRPGAPKPKPEPALPPERVTPEEAQAQAERMTAEATAATEPIPQLPAVPPVERAPVVEEVKPAPVAKEMAAKEKALAEQELPWFESFGEDTKQRIFGAMREIQARVDKASERERELRPPQGSIAVGATGFDEFIKAESQAEVLRSIRMGSTPEQAEIEAKKWAREAVSIHNRKRPKDMNWQRWEGTADSTIEYAVSQLRDSVKEPIKPLPIAEGKAEPTVPPTTPTVSEAGQVSAIPEPAAASAIRQAKPIEEVSQAHVVDKVTLQSGREVELIKLKPSKTERATANRLKQLDAWLVKTAVEDATASGNDHLRTMFANMNPKELSRADRDMLNDHLFGNEKGINLQTAERIEPAPHIAKPPPLAPPEAKAAGKVEQEVQKVARTEGQRPAKEVKSELLARIEEAMHGAPEKLMYSPSEHGTVEINIPGDGNFKVPRNLEALSNMRDRVKRLSTSPQGTPRTPSGKELADIDAVVKDALAVWKDPRQAIAHLEKQLASDQEIDPGHRAMYERGIELLREQLPENILEVKIFDAERRLRDAEQDVRKYEAEVEKYRNRKRKLTTRQQVDLQQMMGTAERARATLTSRRKELSSLIDEKVELEKRLAKPPTPTPAEAKPVGMGGAVESEFQPQQPSTSAMKNAAVDRDRVDRGESPMMDALRKSDPDLWAQAMNIIDQDWQAADKLIARFKAQPFIPTDVDTMVLLHRRVDLKNEFAKLTREADLADAEGRSDAAASAKASRNFVVEKLQELEAMMGKGDAAAGTMAGRAFRARQLVMNEDYSLAELVRERSASLGRPLEDSEVAELREISRAWEAKSAALEKRVTELEAERAQADAQRVAQQAAIDAKAKETPYHPRVLEMAETYAKKWDERGKQALAELKSLWGGEGQMLSGPINPEILDKLAIYGTSKIVRGAVDLAKWTDSMARDLGEKFREHAPDVWKLAQAKLDADLKASMKSFGKIAEQVKKAVKDTGVMTPDRNIADIVGKLAKKAERSRQTHKPLTNLTWPARKIARELWIQGMRDPMELTKAVHAQMVNAIPELTLRQTMDALSTYGQYKLLAKDAVSVGLRDAYGQLQQIAKLEDLSKVPPTLSRTGVERRTPSDIERWKIKQVEAKKKEVNYQPTDPETQLRSAMQAAQRRVDNQIADLEHEIQTRQKIVKNPRKLEYDEKLQASIARRDELKEIRDEIFAPGPLTEAERLQLWKKRNLERIEDYEERMATHDIYPKPRPIDPRLDPEAIKIRFDLHKIHNALMDLRLRDTLSKRSGPRQLIDGTANVIRFSRAMMTGGEFSGVLRQGGFIGFGHPIMATKNLWPMLKALMSEEAQFKISEEIQTRPNAPLYDKAKLDLTEMGTRLSTMEEHYMFRVSERMKKIPGINLSVKFLAAFQRAYTTFLNRLRADAFDKLVDTYGTDDVTIKQVANFINVATGRGSTGLGRWIGPGANAFFFAPRYAISRFQLLLGQPMWEGNLKTRLMILKEYGRALTGAAVVYMLGMAAGAKVEDDSRSPDFGKLKYGNTRLDPLAGLLQITRLLATEATGWRINGKGQMKAIRDENRFFPSGTRDKVEYGQPNAVGVIGTFARYKLSPSVGAGLSLLAGTDPVGRPFHLNDAIIQSAVPITYGDVLKVMQDQGADRGTALAILAIFGMGLQTYDARKPIE